MRVRSSSPSSLSPIGALSACASSPEEKKAPDGTWVPWWGGGPNRAISQGPVQPSVPQGLGVNAEAHGVNAEERGPFVKVHPV